MPLAEFYDQFRTLKYVVRKQLIESPRLIQKPNTAILDLRQFDCPDIDNTLFIEDEVDIQIEKDFASGRKPRARTDFLIMPAQAGWLSLRIGGRPLPAPATAAAFGNEKGASLVFSQHELDGSVIVLLYPPESETRVANFCCFLGRFSRPIEIRVDHIAAFIELLIQFQRVLGFDQHPTRSERLRVWYTRVTTGAKLDGSEPLQFGFRQRLTIYLKQVLGRGALVIGGAIVVAIVVAVLNHIGLDNLANILRGKPL